MTNIPTALAAFLSLSLLPSAAASLAIFDFQLAWTGAKEPDFPTFAANSASVDTDVNSTTSLLSNNGFNDGGYNSFSLKDSVANTSIYSTSATPDTGMNLGGANQTTATNYLSFTVVPDSGFETTYQSLTLFTDTNAQGDQYNVELRAVDGDGDEMVMGTIHSHTPLVSNEPVHQVTFDFPDFISGNVTEWRIYAYNTIGLNNGVRFDDITLNGTTTPSAPLSITDIDVDGNVVALVWTSRENQLYTVRFSLDLSDWSGDINDNIPADAGDKTTYSFDLSDFGLENEPRVFFRVEEG